MSADNDTETLLVGENDAVLFSINTELTFTNAESHNPDHGPGGWEVGDRVYIFATDKDSKYRHEEYVGKKATVLIRAGQWLTCKIDGIDGYAKLRRTHTYCIPKDPSDPIVTEFDYASIVKPPPARAILQPAIIPAVLEDKEPADACLLDDETARRMGIVYIHTRGVWTAKFLPNEALKYDLPKPFIGNFDTQAAAIMEKKRLLADLIAKESRIAAGKASRKRAKVEFIVPVSDVPRDLLNGEKSSRKRSKPEGVNSNQLVAWAGNGDAVVNAFRVQGGNADLHGEDFDLFLEAVDKGVLRGISGVVHKGILRWRAIFGKPELDAYNVTQRYIATCDLRDEAIRVKAAVLTHLHRQSGSNEALLKLLVSGSLVASNRVGRPPKVTHDSSDDDNDAAEVDAKDGGEESDADSTDPALPVAVLAQSKPFSAALTNSAIWRSRLPSSSIEVFNPHGRVLDEVTVFPASKVELIMKKALPVDLSLSPEAVRLARSCLVSFLEMVAADAEGLFAARVRKQQLAIDAESEDALKSVTTGRRSDAIASAIASAIPGIDSESNMNIDEHSALAQPAAPLPASIPQADARSNQIDLMTNGQDVINATRRLGFVGCAESLSTYHRLYLESLKPAPKSFPIPKSYSSAAAGASKPSAAVVVLRAESSSSGITEFREFSTALADTTVDSNTAVALKRRRRKPKLVEDPSTRVLASTSVDEIEPESAPTNQCVALPPSLSDFQTMFPDSAPIATAYAHPSVFVSPPSHSHAHSHSHSVEETEEVVGAVEVVETVEVVEQSSSEEIALAALTGLEEDSSRITNALASSSISAPQYALPSPGHFTSAPQHQLLPISSTPIASLTTNPFEAGLGVNTISLPAKRKEHTKLHYPDGRRAFGIRELPSGRWAPSFTDKEKKEYHNVPRGETSLGTFDTSAEAIAVKFAVLKTLTRKVVEAVAIPDGFELPCGNQIEQQITRSYDVGDEVGTAADAAAADMMGTDEPLIGE